MDPKIKSVTTTSGNVIELELLNKTVSSPFPCLTHWNGKFRILSSSETISKKDMDEMREKGLFGEGQIVSASLDLPSLTITFSGTCDSGD